MRKNDAGHEREKNIEGRRYADGWIIASNNYLIKKMTNKIDLRESLNILNSEATTPEEVFQNQTLRPVLKLQNDLYGSLFTSYAIRQNADFMLYL
jgi:hypothetical protein